VMLTNRCYLTYTSAFVFIITSIPCHKGRNNPHPSTSASKPARAKRSTRSSTTQKAAQRSTRSNGQRKSTPTPPSPSRDDNRAEMICRTFLLGLTVFLGFIYEMELKFRQ
jgi:hypothetical protein